MHEYLCYSSVCRTVVCLLGMLKLVWLKQNTPLSSLPTTLHIMYTRIIQLNYVQINRQLKLSMLQCSIIHVVPEQLQGSTLKFNTNIFRQVK